VDLSNNYEKAGFYQAFQYRQSYQRQQIAVLAAIVAATVISSALCSPELTYAMILGTYLLVGYGESLTDKLEMTRRRVEDYEAVSDEAFSQIAYNDMLSQELPAETVGPVALTDGLAYLQRAAVDWRAHVGLLAPTDTGKSSFVTLLLSLTSRKRPICVIAVEAKGADYPGVPEQNIFRLKARPTLAEIKQLIRLLEGVYAIAQARADKRAAIDYQLILILEEWLSVYNTIKKIDSLKKYAAEIESYIYTLVGMGRGCGVQVVLVAQSNVADDLGVSGSVRSNLRYTALGSRLGGFDGVENAFLNARIVPPSRRDDCKVQFDAAIKRLKTNRHPLVLTNLVGQLEIFPMPYFSESELAQLQIQSLPANDELTAILTDSPKDFAGESPAQPEPTESTRLQILTELGINPEPQSDNLPDSQGQLTISDIEELVLSFLESRSEENFLASEIKRNVRALKDSRVPLGAIEKVCEGLVTLNRIVRISPATDRDKPRYMAQ